MTAVTDEEVVRSALRRLNPEFHELDAAWEALTRIVDERDRGRVAARRYAELLAEKADSPTSHSETRP